MHFRSWRTGTFRMGVLVILPVLFTTTLLGLGCNGSKQVRDQLVRSGANDGGQGDGAYSDTATGRQVRAHLHVMVSVGKDVERKYQQSLAKLRENPDAIDTLFESYSRTPEALYHQRQLLIETLKEMRSERALDHLRKIASQRIPGEQFTDEKAEYSTVEEEIVIRVTAVEGISLLASDGNAAHKILRGFVTHGDLTVRQMAARGYILAAGQEGRRKRILELRRLLPVEEHWMLTPTSTDVTSVPHPKMPEQFDLSSLKNETSPPPKSKE